MSNDGFATGGNRQPQHHVILGIGEVRPPKEEDALPVCNLADEVQKIFDILTPVPEARGRGLSRRVLSALEAEAARLNVKRIVLETGPRQHAALALYERSGYERISLFGEYIGSPMSICMEKRL